MADDPTTPTPSVLDAVERSVVRLYAAFDTRPDRLAVTVGEVSVVAQWTDGQPVGAAPTPAAATGPADPAVAGPAGPAAGPVPAGADPPTDRLDVIAPTVGVFYRSPQPGAPPFVDLGDPVVAGQQLGIVEAMKLMIPVTADRPGTVAEVVTADGADVEYGEPLFRLHPIVQGGQT